MSTRAARPLRSFTLMIAMIGLPVLQAAAELPVAYRKDVLSPRAVVVALHGIQTHSSWFKGLGNALAAQRVSLWAVNVPERGMAHPPAADAEDWRADWVNPLCETAQKAHQKTGLPVVLLGTSWGARPVLRAAVEAGHGAGWCRGVVLVAPALKTSADLGFAWRASLSPAAWFASSTSSFDLPLKPGDYTCSDDLKKQWLDDKPGTEGERLVRQTTRRHFRETRELRSEVTDRLGSVDVPLLALFGSADTLVDLHVADCMLGGIKGVSETRIIADGTHAMQLDKPTALAKHISGWLERQLEGKTPSAGTVHLDSRQAYFDCGVDVVKGRRYKFQMDKGQAWQDARLGPSDPAAGDFSLHKIGAGWLRRVRRDALDHTLRPRYFQPIVTIGKNDATGIVVQPGRVWAAHDSGRLYAFANDADWKEALRNNHGFITFCIVPAD